MADAIAVAFSFIKGCKMRTPCDDCGKNIAQLNYFSEFVVEQINDDGTWDEIQRDSASLNDDDSGSLCYFCFMEKFGGELQGQDQPVTVI